MQTAVVALPDKFSPTLLLDQWEATSTRILYRRLAPQRAARLAVSPGTGIGAGEPNILLLDFDFAAEPGACTVTLAEGELTQAELVALTRRLLGFEDDLDAGERHLRRDPMLAPIVAAQSGLRLSRSFDLWEALLLTVLGQQVSVAAANAIRQRLFERFGTTRSWQAQTLLAPPTPAVLLDAGDDDLRACGVSRAKIRCLRAIAEWLRDDPPSQAELDSWPDQTLIETLCRLPGIGRWTAENVAMRGLGRRDMFPAADIGLANAVQRCWNLPERPSAAALLERAEAWRGWRSYAALHLWFHLKSAGYG